NIIQQPDSYRTYNKKTHIERAGLECRLNQHSSCTNSVSIFRLLAAHLLFQECQRFLEHSLRIGNCGVKQVLRSLLVQGTERFAPPPLRQGMRVYSELDARLLFGETREEENNRPILLKRQMFLALRRFASFFTVHSNHPFVWNSHEDMLLWTSRSNGLLKSGMLTRKQLRNVARARIHE